MIKEACVENFTDVPSLLARGARRIELCDNLAVGGTTPSIGVIRVTTRYCQERAIPVVVMIRPRGGDFVYTPDEREIMICDLEAAARFNPAGIVIGALTEERELDKAFLAEIAGLAKERQLELVFHMAFDHIPKDKQAESLLWLEEAGFARILTHGGPMERPIFEHIEHLRELMQISPTMTVMPGGGITRDNVEALREVLGFQEVHGTRIV